MIHGEGDKRMLVYAGRRNEDGTVSINAIDDPAVTDFADQTEAMAHVRKLAGEADPACPRFGIDYSTWPSTAER